MSVVTAFAALALSAGPGGTPTNLVLPAASAHADQRANDQAGVKLRSLRDITIKALRARRYGSKLYIVADLAQGSNAKAYAERFFGGGQAAYASVLASYRSDGLRLYTRIDVPNAPPPAGGYPVIVFLHGWVGYEAARDFHFSYTPESMYAEMIDAYAKAGFVVVTPGYRGHGTVNGRVADGRASMAAWDNATHLAPIFYAIDTLNLIDGLDSVAQLDWQPFGHAAHRVRLNLGRLSVAGHSQGGDAALTLLAISGRGSRVVHRPRAGSIMSGTFADRFTQVETYRPMAESSEAFLSGDGTWTGSARGANGAINPHFVFAWPDESIETLDPGQWNWQKERLGAISVCAVARSGFSEMYQRFRSQVADMASLKLISAPDEARKDCGLQQERALARVLPQIGGFRSEAFITARVSLHFSDRDYYSLPDWNYDLCARIKRAGGRCEAHEYRGSTHTLRLSRYTWFSPPGSREAYTQIISRDLAAFR